MAGCSRPARRHASGLLPTTSAPSPATPSARRRRPSPRGQHFPPARDLALAPNAQRRPSPCSALHLRAHGRLLRHPRLPRRPRHLRAARDYDFRRRRREIRSRAAAERAVDNDPYDVTPSTSPSRKGLMLAAESRGAGSARPRRHRRRRRDAHPPAHRQGRSPPPRPHRAPRGPVSLSPLGTPARAVTFLQCLPRLRARHHNHRPSSERRHPRTPRSLVDLLPPPPTTPPKPAIPSAVPPSGHHRHPRRARRPCVACADELTPQNAATPAAPPLDLASGRPAGMPPTPTSSPSPRPHHTRHTTMHDD